MIYLDHNATTPPFQAVIEACTNAMRALPGNPSSIHRPGQAARNALEHARAQVAALIHAPTRDITFCSGATEANQLAIRGYLGQLWLRDTSAHKKPLTLITSNAEHPSVMGAAAACVEHFGVRWLKIPLDSAARLDLTFLETALNETPTPALVSVMLAQNELGNIYPLREITALAHAKGAKVHCDATQAVGRIPVNITELGVDFLSFSAHKLGGPRGAAALYVRGRLALDPLMRGGHQEHGLRAGTENLPALVGFGVAADIARTQTIPNWSRVRALGDHLWTGLQTHIPNIQLLGDTREDFVQTPIPTRNLGNTLCIAFPGAPADELLMALDMAGIFASAGSACSSGSLEPSPVLLAAGIDEALARCAIRFSIGPSTSDNEIQKAITIISAQVAHVRSVVRS